MNTLLILLLFGCPYVGEPAYNDEIRDYDGDGVIAERFGGEDCRDDDPSIKFCDADGDGHRIPEVGGDDCDDSNPLVFPGSDEICNEVDDNCDGLIDDQDPLLANAPLWYLDGDQDGYGDPALSLPGCVLPEGYAADDRDCDDSNAEVFPGSIEFCDELDRDCDGDPTAGAVDPQDWYADNDGDGFGFGPSVGQSCEPLPGTAPAADDCDDTEPLAFPGATEIWYDGVDSDCDGGSDFDQDGDGFDIPVDCDDLDSTLSPDATEVCDGGIDNDCDGVADNDDPSTSPLGQFIYYQDADGDGEGADDSATGFCPGTEPDGWVLLAGDCDDSLDTVNSGGIEVCDSLDNNCNGVVDDNAIGQVDYFVDSDGDGYGGATIQGSCSAEPGLALVGGDCDDGDPLSYPGAPEICGDLTRQDCSSLSVFDCDSDGFDDVASGGSDCDDTRDDVYPGANEVCDGIDNNCVDGIDDDDPAVDTSTVADWFLDADLDGFGSAVLVAVNACAPLPGASTNADDCDDSDPNTYPDALELCDGIDNSCDGEIDEDPLLAPTIFYYDQDGDGFGNPDITDAQGCDPPGPQWVLIAGDCADDAAEANPDALEICDGIDNNCDGLTDSADPLALVNTWYLDDDGDGYGVDGSTLSQCEQPSGYSGVSGDCDDADSTTNPGAAEICDGNIDNDCDGLGDDADPDLSSSVTWYEDLDGDGYGNPNVSLVQCSRPPGWVVDNSDCDDNQPTISPAAAELCDGLDNDCDGLFDDEDPNVLDATLWFADLDGDLWGDTSNSIRSCTQPSGRLATGGDCNDSNPAINPTAIEICDGLDNDCDELLDDADPNAELLRWFEDLDLDGFGEPNVFLEQCPDPGAQWSSNDSDCNDTDPLINPLAAEICNYVDDNCDGQVDDDDPTITGQPTWYADADADGYGNLSTPLQQCGVPTGFVSNGDDCDDSDPLVSPGISIEFCNGYDDNCDGLTDDDDPLLIETFQFYPDLDGDMFGDENNVIRACAQPPNTVTTFGDCDDLNASVNPGRAEVCDPLEVDEDCNGFANEADTGLTDGLPSYPDLDGDGQAAPGSAPISYCYVVPEGFSTLTSDCDDNDPERYDGAPELCDGRDNNCNFIADEFPNDPNVFRDFDLDGFGDPSFPTPNICPTGSGSVFDDSDCNDADPDIHPNADEICDGLDNDCDNLVDDDDDDTQDKVNWYFDADDDGYGESGTALQACDSPGTTYVKSDGDCAPEDPGINPGKPEVCDLGLVDENCNGLVNSDDTGVMGALATYLDADLDGYGSETLLPISYCPGEEPPGTSLSNDDCRDYDNSTYPGAPELCDAIDNNCDDSLDNNPTDNNIFEDSDGDGYGGTIVALTCPGGGASTSVFGSDDCDDSDPQISPDAIEICDGGVDNNCDGITDDADPLALGKDTYYEDLDLDGYGTVTSSSAFCSDPGLGWSVDNTDCDDSDILVYPTAAEICDGGVDNNCNGLLDDADPAIVNADEWYYDEDEDGYGVIFASVRACTQPTGFVPTPGDCIDLNADINPGANEVCNDFDDNCNGLVDDTDPALDTATTTVWYADLDGDGFTGSDTVVSACSPPVGFGVGSAANDCNDNDPAIHPAAIEICDTIDNDCDTVVDGAAAIDAQEWFSDIDGDGFGDAAGPLGSLCTPPADASTNSLDCDDNQPTVYFSALEVCDGLDNNCDGLVDDDDPYLWSGQAFYVDADGDGFGDDSVFVNACGIGPGYSEVGGDCDDSNPNAFPNQDFTVGPTRTYTSIQDAINDACDGAIINVDPGTYNENLTFIGRPITILGAGPASTIVEAPSPAVTVPPGQPSGTQLLSLTLRSNGVPYAGNGAGIFVNPNGYLDVQFVTFEDFASTSGAGGGIYASENSTLFTNNVVFTDVVSTFADLVYTRGSWNATQLSATWPITSGSSTAIAAAAGSTINGSQWNIDGAISMIDIDSASVTIADSVLRGQPANLVGIGIYIRSTDPAQLSTLLLTDSTLAYNWIGITSPGSGGDTATSVTLLNNNLLGHAIALDLSNVDDSVLQYNTIPSFSGAGGYHVRITGGRYAEFDHNTLYAFGDVTTDASQSNRLNRNIIMSLGQVPAANFTLSGFNPDANLVDDANTAATLNAFGTSTNLSADPLFMTAGLNLPIEHLDLHLQPSSPAIDYYVGGSFVVDTDGTNSDIGAYSGSWGEPHVDIGFYYYGDLDGDLLYDGWEFEHYGDTTLGPNDDFDGDGLDSLTEFQLGTLPESPDTDQDGVLDGDEVTAATDPKDSTSF